MIQYSFLMLQVARSVLMCDCILQMSDNRRRGGRRAQQEQAAPQDTPTAAATTAPDDYRADVPNADSGGSSHWSDSDRYAAAASSALAPTSASDASDDRDKRVEFMRGHPPVFAHSFDPMDAED
jgi:hypothetical protein